MRIPYLRTTKNYIKLKKLDSDLKNMNWLFSERRKTMILNEWNEWTKFYLPIDVKDKTVLDVGAGEGETALFYLLNGAKKVICIEPNKNCYDILLRNSKFHNRIIPINIYFELNMININSDLIKIDIEGYEEKLLELNHDKLKNRIVLEIHGLQLIDKFKNRGYNLKSNPIDEWVKFGYWCC